MEDNLILEGLLSMVTELKEKLEAQVTPASREETLERFGAIEQALSRLHNNPAVPVGSCKLFKVSLTMYGTGYKVSSSILRTPRKYHWKSIVILK